MALSNMNHFFNGFDIPPLFCQSLSHLNVVNGIRELSDDTKNVLLDEMT